MNPKLVGISGPLQGTELLLSDGESFIGRDPSNTLWIADPAMSRRHCLINRTQDSIVLRDLESHNGTHLNGVPVVEQELHHGDQISLGDSVLVFLRKDDPTHLGKSRVELADTPDLSAAPVLLREQDAVYLNCDKLVKELPGNARLTRDLNSLLKIATERDAAAAAIALAWVLAKNPGATPLIGATSAQQLDVIEQALSTELTPDEINALEDPYVARLSYGH